MHLNRYIKFDNSGMIFPTVLIARRYIRPKYNRESGCTATKVEATFTPNEDAQGDRESEERDCINPHVKPSPKFVEYDGIEVTPRRRSPQTLNT